MESGPDCCTDFPQHELRVVLQSGQYPLLVRAHLAVGLNKSGWKVGALQAARGRPGLAGEGEQGVPRGSRARYGIWIVRLEGKQRLDVRFGLSRGGVEVEAQDMCGFSSPTRSSAC